MTNKPTAKRKTDYDPTRQWGLKPKLETDGSTYIVSGHIVGASGSDSLFATEGIGREGQAKAKRKLEKAEAEKSLRQLAARDREGMEAVMKAREVVKGQKAKAKEGETAAKGKGKGKAKQQEAEEEDGVEEEVQRKAYSTSLVRSLGFDPTVKAGQRRVDPGSTGESKVSVPFACEERDTDSRYCSSKLCKPFRQNAPACRWAKYLRRRRSSCRRQWTLRSRIRRRSRTRQRVLMKT